MLETVAALAILSLGVVAIHGALRQAVLARATAQDYTRARFLLEDMVARLELEPFLMEGTHFGSFGGSYSRFHYACTVSKLILPAPVIPPELLARPGFEIELPVPYLGKIHATVSWTRAGRSYEETVETLFNPDRLYVPEEALP